MDDEFILVLVTTPSAEAAEQIASVLVEDGLAACVNILPPMQSIYRWQGEIVRESEVLLLCKTRRELFETQFIPLVTSMHSYELPEIIAVPIQGGLRAYLDWIRESTQPTG